MYICIYIIYIYIYTYIYSATVRILGFDLPQRSDRVSSRCGGVAVDAREGLKYSLIDSPSSPDFQCVVVNL